jgi:hypothetical protein
MLVHSILLITFEFLARSLIQSFLGLSFFFSWVFVILLITYYNYVATSFVVLSSLYSLLQVLLLGLLSFLSCFYHLLSSCVQNITPRSSYSRGTQCRALRPTIFLIQESLFDLTFSAIFGLLKCHRTKADQGVMSLLTMLNVLVCKFKLNKHIQAVSCFPDAPLEYGDLVIRVSSGEEFRGGLWVASGERCLRSR